LLCDNEDIPEELCIPSRRGSRLSSGADHGMSRLIDLMYAY